MKVLVIGSGGREHTIVWKISQNKQVSKIFCAPGNAGTATLAQNINISATDIQGLLDFVKNNKIDLTIVGPEAPLVLGIVDLFEKNNFRIFGPNSKGALLEGSKIFSKEIMTSANVPTAKYILLNATENLPQVLPFTKAAVKADGLAAGKGVIICQNEKEISSAVIKLRNEFKDASKQILIEELLVGEEASMLAFCDGKTAKLMISAQDHKRIFDNDLGPNTGGVGAYAPAPITNGLETKIMNTVFVPMMKELNKRKILYKGVLYAGLMINNGELKVLEFNSRFGDPETQPLLSLLKTDIIEIMNACIDGTLDRTEIKWKSESACCVVLTAKGYPGDYTKGDIISGIDEAEKDTSTHVFHSGTTTKEEQVITSGGRVLGVTSTATTLQEAIQKAYLGVSKIEFNGLHFRKDIGKKALK